MKWLSRLYPLSRSSQNSRFESWQGPPSAEALRSGIVEVENPDKIISIGMLRVLYGRF